MKEKFKEDFDIALDVGVSFFGGLVQDTLIGQIAPGLVTAYLGHKQKKTERNIRYAIELINKDIESIKADIKKLSKSEANAIIENAGIIVFDNINNEQQKEKIEYLINGMRTIIDQKITEEDIILTYYDILKELRLVDIKILVQLYEKKFDKGWRDDEQLNEPNEINKYELIEKYIVKKLESLNLVIISKTWDDLEGEDNKVNPKLINISLLGVNLVDFFRISNNEKKGDLIV